MLRSIPCVSVVLLALPLAGCPQYYTVEEACNPSDKVPGGSFLDALEKDAMNRINCYRRLSGVAMATANELVQVAADGQAQYVVKNPEMDHLFGKLREHEWLTQQFDDPGFTGTNAYERLTDVEHGAGYTFYDVGGTGIWEYIKVVQDDAQRGPAPSGSAAVDYLMRDPEFRQVALQPSWVDGAYAEFALTPEWFSNGGWAEKYGDAPLPTGGRVYYMLTLYTAPHIEHSDRPVWLPKPDQTDVPLYGWSENLEAPIEISGGYPKVQLSWPITFTVGALDPATYAPVDQNQYSTEITAASIVGPTGPLETEVVHPGDVAEDVWPAATFLRTTIALYTREPFEPSTQYTVYADMSHPEGDFAIEYTFRTRADDPGVDPNLGRTVVPTTPTTP